MNTEKPRWTSSHDLSIKPVSGTLAECQWETPSVECCAGFAAWLDQELAKLEQQFRSFTTPRSLMKAIR